MGYQAIGPDKKSVRVELTEHIGGGGEGYVYATNMPGYVAKVYKAGHATENKYRKCNWFVSKQICHDRICLPTHLLADDDDNFVGYLMPKAAGEMLSSVIHPMELQEKYPEWTRLHLAKLCSSLLEQINFLHENGILVCDLDMNNILVDGVHTKDPKTFIIDCDSFQIGAGASMMFPGDVGRPLATPKELQDVPFDEQARTVSNEYFSITVLLFKILMPNQNPYMVKGGKNDESQLVKEGLFPYTADPAKIRKVADKIPGEWATEVWSHLPAYITETFWNNLHKNGAHYSPGKRTNIKEWQTCIERYDADLRSSRSDQDRLNIFPVKKKKKEPKKDEIVVIDAKKYKLAERADEFKYASNKIDLPVPTFSIFLISALFTAAYLVDPFSIISKTSLNVFPSFVVDYLWWVAVVPVAVVLYFMLKAVLKSVEKARSRHYSKLSQKAMYGDICTRTGKVKSIYKGEVKKVDTLLKRDKVISNIIGIVMALLLCAVAYLIYGEATSYDGWNIYSTDDEIAYVESDKAVLNSLTDGMYGDETDFVQASSGSYIYRGLGGSDSRDWTGDVLELSPNEPYAIRVLIRNDSFDPQAIAENVHVTRKAQWEDLSCQDMTVTYYITYDDGTGESQTISDSVKLHFSARVNPNRYPCHIIYLRNQTYTLGEKHIKSDVIDSDEGVAIGIDGLDGAIPGDGGYCLIYEDCQEIRDASSLFTDGWSYYTEPGSNSSYASFVTGEPILNSLENSSYGDETDFVQAMAVESDDYNPSLEDASMWHGDVLEVETGKPYMIRVFLRNDHKDENAELTDVHLSRDNKWNSDRTEETTIYTAYYRNGNGNVYTVTDSVTVRFTEPVDTKTFYYRCSLRSPLLGKGDAVVLSDNSTNSYKVLSSAEGMLVGTAGFDGVIPGGDDGYCLFYQYNYWKTEGN